MPSPKSGKAGTIVAPAAPTAALDADDADPGKVEDVKATERELKKGKYGSENVKPYKKPETKEEKEEKPHWIEIVLKDDDGKPVPGETYRITMPDGSVKEGTLDGDGYARVDGIDPGSCKVTFPKLDSEAWHPS